MKIIKLSAIDSTNTYLKNLAKDEAINDGTVVVAERQISGRGQVDASWLSREGQSLTYSIYKQFERVGATDQFAISMAVSLAIVKALGQLNVPQISIKWPNDILSANKKVGGILIENVLDGNGIRYSIIGIGINVNETDFPQLPQASSLYLETGSLFNIEEVLAVTAETILQYLEKIDSGNFEKLKTNYESKLFRRNKVAVFEDLENNRFNGIIKGVASSGELIVETENGNVKKYQLKEIKMIY